MPAPSALRHCEYIFMLAKTASKPAQRSDVRGRLSTDAFRTARVEDGNFVAAEEDDLGY